MSILIFLMLLGRCFIHVTSLNFILCTIFFFFWNEETTLIFVLYIMTLFHFPDQFPFCKVSSFGKHVITNSAPSWIDLTNFANLLNTGKLPNFYSIIEILWLAYSLLYMVSFHSSWFLCILFLVSFLFRLQTSEKKRRIWKKRKTKNC